MKPRCFLILGLAALTAVRLAVAASVPLAPDETYYRVWSRVLQPGYLDHPPMVALWIRAGVWLLGASSLGVRCLAPISAAVGSILVWDAAEHLFPGRRAGVAAALLLNATLAFGAGAVLMTPDTPLLFFWTAALWAGARIATGGGARWWLAAGAFAGLALDSKYTAAFLPLGFGLFALWVAPRSLRRPAPWLGFGLCALLFVPVIAWNAAHAWAGFARQGGRVADWHPAHAVSFVAELAAGQAGLATPLVFVLFVVGVAVALRAAVRVRPTAESLIAAMTVPAALVFLQHALGDRVQGNWPAILYPGAALAVSGLTRPVWRRLVRPAAALGFALTAAIYLHAATGWPLLPARSDPVARQLAGWDDLAARVEAARRDAGARFVAAEPYGLAAELAWTLPAGAAVVGAGPHWDTFALPRAAPERGEGLLLRPERYDDTPDPGAWREVARLPDIERPGGGERYSVFRVVPAGAAAGAVLPPK